ncbi:hypothetical protein CLOSTASPAR_02596 [[Clostridium] asparagiforme DSM 15981]|uniref:Uncharacterized protein n=1 Tax=[Clostridium] asparagiforme DSM 15981 TaxID=518636 RepID=C0D014_9FIRM|nr:hypothetical protein CLOSTASPAR_02596 [[Clostridium] asparagiforme DSM 15981]
MVIFSASLFYLAEKPLCFQRGGFYHLTPGRCFVQCFFKS